MVDPAFKKIKSHLRKAIDTIDDEAETDPREAYAGCMFEIDSVILEFKKLAKKEGWPE